MSPLALVLLIGFSLVALWALGALPMRTRRQLGRAAVYAAIAVAAVILLRLGMPWFAAIGAFLLAGLRVLGGPLLRLAPMLFGWLFKRKLANSGDAKPPSTNESHAASTRMTRSEALAVLGLGEEASPDDIRKAHAELILRVHPDRGGSSYLATRVNLARDVLLPKSEHT